MEADEKWMTLAIAVAFRGTPIFNPRVGAVIVAEGRFVSLGWHERVGGPHAEIVALADAGRGARNSTLYVTLEPCNHYGRTPPCVDAILASGVRRVVIGARDPNPHVAGGGMSSLERAGLEVCVGVLASEAWRLIEPWAHVVSGGRATQTRRPSTLLRANGGSSRR